VSIKILLLEDDLLFAETLIDLLEDEGYEIFHVPNGQSALDQTFHKKFDLYLLDINVPLIDGISVLKALREAQDETPAMFLTSHKDKESLEQGFLSGADDYITKPFENTELLLRLHALLKRSKKLDKKTIGDFCYDTKKSYISYKEEVLQLSKKEYQLLLLFLQNINTPVPKELIIDELWGTTESGSSGALRVYVNRLKQLLPDIEIQNIRGIGYKLVS
jgi:DNA-binding response OmpR family regulator